MPPIDAPWVRPLLDLTRAQTREVAERLELPFVDDPTNDDPKHFRVGIRTQMLPRLRAENPRLERAFVSTAEQARDAEQALEGWAQRECAARARAGRRWDICGFEQLPRAVRTRMVRAMCREGGVDIGALTHQIVDAIEAAALRRASKRWDLHPNQRLFLEKDEIRVEPAQGHL